MLSPSDILRADFWEECGCLFAEEWQGPVPQISEAERVICFKTSGSTGQPKWIVLEKRSLLLSARAVNRWLDVKADSCWGLALPLHHVGGFGVAARAYAADCELRHYSKKWNACDFLKWLEHEKVSHVSLVPTQLHDLVKLGLRGAESLRAIIVGGGKLSEDLGQAARDLGWPVLASYGMTETCSQVATQRMDLLELPFRESPLELLPIWKAETSGEGLLRLRGDALFSGSIEQGLFQKREEEWFTSKDRAKVDGSLIIPLGRSDALVKVMGELVDLDSVESRLAGFLEGAEFAVVAIFDSRREHALVLCSVGVVPTEAIAAYQARAIGPERLVKWIQIDAFPKSDLGKLKRHELRQLAEEMDGMELL